jgi:uncharacterized protein (DUF885 family)
VRAIDRAKVAIEDQAEWIREILPGAVPDWAIGREQYGEILKLRAFDGLDDDAILEIGWQQIEHNHAMRAAAAREIDPNATEAEVVERVKDDHPATFDEALVGYRDAMARARRHLIERDIATVPDDERVEVIATPPYLRGVLPFAAYFEPARWDRSPIGIYVVTPDVGWLTPGAMREHYRASISNTSIHEAYPGHHLQLALGGRHPSLTARPGGSARVRRGLGHVQRADDARGGLRRRTGVPRRARDRRDLARRAHRAGRPHAPRRAVDRAGSGLPHPAHRLRAAERARRGAALHVHADVQPLVPAGKVLLLKLREDERSGLGTRFSLRDFHDTLLNGGSLPVSFHRRALRGEGRS